MATLTCVILHYWLERTANIEIILQKLNEGSYKPDKIIVFNNNKDFTYPQTEGVSVINSNHNYGGRARYPIALLEPSDYYVYIDDDVAPNRDTISRLMQFVDKDSCVGYVGKVLQGKSYVESKTIFGNEIDKPMDVDLLVGTGMILCSHQALLRMFQTEGKLLAKGFEFGRDEDIILTMSNKSKVIPVNSDEFPIPLDTRGVGYCVGENHNKQRNKVTELLIDRIS